MSLRSLPEPKSFHHRPAYPKPVEPAHGNIRLPIALQARQRPTAPWIAGSQIFPAFAPQTRRNFLTRLP
jgi:hypothetical protein